MWPTFLQKGHSDSWTFEVKLLVCFSSWPISLLKSIPPLVWSWGCWVWFKPQMSQPCRVSFADSPRRFWWYHWICWTLSAVGIFCILLAHDHYTVDVVVAYFITTRLFWWYHTMANQQVSAACSTGTAGQFLILIRFFETFYNNYTLLGIGEALVKY